MDQLHQLPPIHSFHVFIRRATIIYEIYLQIHLRNSFDENRNRITVQKSFRSSRVYTFDIKTKNEEKTVKKLNCQHDALRA